MRRPITAVDTADLSCICEIIRRSCGLEPRIASFKLNRNQTAYAHDLVRHEVVRRELVSIIVTSRDDSSHRWFHPTATPEAGIYLLKQIWKRDSLGGGAHVDL